MEEAPVNIYNYVLNNVFQEVPVNLTVYIYFHI